MKYLSILCWFIFFSSSSFSQDAHYIGWSKEELKTYLAAAGIPDVNFDDFSTLCFAKPEHNFGVVVYNQHFQLYRSQALGKEGTLSLFKHLEENGLKQPKLVIHMNKEGYIESPINRLSLLSHRFSRFLDFVREEAELFRMDGLYPDVTYMHPLNSSVYLSGKNPVTEVELVFTKNILGSKARSFFTDQLGHIDELFMSKKENIYTILKAILGKKKALFHCTGGVHRTGMIALAIRYLQGGDWIKPFPKPFTTKAFYQSKTLTTDVVVRNKAQLEYFMHNRTYFRQQNLEAIEKLSQEDEFYKLKEKYAPLLNLPSKCPMLAAL